LLLLIVEVRGPAREMTSACARSCGHWRHRWFTQPAWVQWWGEHAPSRAGRPSRAAGCFIRAAPWLNQVYLRLP